MERYVGLYLPVGQPSELSPVSWKGSWAPRDGRTLARALLPAVVLPLALALLGLATQSAAQGAGPAPVSAAPGGAATVGKTFTFRLPGEPETLDWNRAHTQMETTLLMNLMEGLVAFDQNLKVVPLLAKSWTRSDDGRTYTFRLRTDVKWSDGVPLKAKDFVFSWRRLLSPVTAASYAYLLFDIEGAEYFYQGKIKDFDDVGIKAPDDHTLVIKLARPVAHWLQIPTFWVTFPLRADVVEKHGEGWAKPGRMVTLGPFTLESYEMDAKVVLKANPTYAGTKGNVDQVVALIVKDDATALTLFESGKFDFLVDISTLDLPRFRGKPELVSYNYLKTGYLGFATNRYPVSNRNVRRAISMAIDKSKIGDVLQGGQKAAGTFVPPGIAAHQTKFGLPFDPEKARAELKLSGLTQDPTKKLKLELLCPNWDKVMTLAQFIQGELKKNLGIEVSLAPFDHKTFREQLDLKTYPLFTGTWAADFPDPDNFLSVFLSFSGNNRTSWKQEKFDDRVLEARNILEVKAREKAYLDTQKTLIEDEAVIVPLYYEPINALVRTKVKGLQVNPLNYLYLKHVRID
jgi:oligopeptide transport system substrate-binding protein